MRPEFQDIVDEVSRLLGGPVTLEDREFDLVAFCAQHAGQIDEIRQQSILERHSSGAVRRMFEGYGIASSERPVHVPAMPAHGVLARVCLPARWHAVTYGYVWLLADGVNGGALEAAVDAGARMTQATALAARAGALLAQQARVREELGYKLQDLLSADNEIAALAAEDIRERGLIERGVPVAVIELRLGPRDSPQPVNLGSLPHSVLAWPEVQHTTLLVPVPGGDLDPARDVAARARDLHGQRSGGDGSLDVVAGIGAPRPDLTGARESWQEARLACQVCLGVPSLGPVAAWSELGVYRLLGCGPHAALASAVLDGSVRKLLDADSPDLVRTAMVFLDAAGNVHRTADALSVHRQTVYYRLQHIESITGLHLGRGEDRLLLHLGLTMAPFLATDASPG